MILPVIVLAIWSLVVLGWLVRARFAAMAKAGIDLKASATRGGRGQDLEKLLPPEACWPAHNYAHLVEQPTLFYAVAVGVAVMGAASPLNVGLAWAYVLLRIAHSLWQIKVNTIPTRVKLFGASTLALWALAISALVSAVRML
jgi:hypothetical protein